MKSDNLKDKSCAPCRGDAQALKSAAIDELKGQLSTGWTINPAGHLHKQFVFKNFKKAMDFARKVTEIAELEKHHPDLHIAWGKCGVEIWTHAVSGLTENDFILAVKIDQIAS